MKKIIYGMGLVIAMASCATFKNYEAQQIKTDNIVRKELTDSVTVSDTTALLHWQDFYKDHRLQTFIREGLERNSELETARLRTEEAIASLRGARGLLRPSASITAESNVSSFERAKPDKTYSIGTSISWETDIFGKQRNAVKGAMASVAEREAYRQLVQTRLIATIAQSYYTLEMLDAKRKVLQETIESWQQQILVMQALMEAGEAERGSIAQAEASRYEAQTLLEQIDRQRFETESALSILLGRTSDAIDRGSFSTQDFSYHLVHHLPITALATRPDMRQAEAALRSAFYQVNVARGAFYPSLRLSGTLGWINNGGTGIVNPGGILLQAVASLAQPLFANGQNRANLAIAQSQHKQALVHFSQTLLEAGNEVNNALKAYHAANNQTRLQQLQIEKLQEAVNASHAQMLYGDGNTLQIIVARQSLLTARLQQLSSEYEQIESYIILFRALGGGY
ncbi:efflux transporter outer membrane subunit [Prevotella falsenii]|uniref:efflux transporter outer membrane subunit n=1 Tax=Prevotella falsenii TaxID=515414 RepID=UPI000469DC7E|nr:efflux transporter outer membrane subunit [Prevotella falsenii]